MKDELQEIGFDKDKMVIWTRGANHGAFQKPKKIIWSIKDQFIICGKGCY